MYTAQRKNKEGEEAQTTGLRGREEWGPCAGENDKNSEVLNILESGVGPPVSSCDEAVTLEHVPRHDMR